VPLNNISGAGSDRADANGRKFLSAKQRIMDGCDGYAARP